MMKKYIFLFALATTNFAFSMPTVGEVETPMFKTQAFREGEHDHLRVESIQSGDFLVVKPMEVSGFSGASLQKLDLAFDVLEEVVNSEEFKERVINFKNTKGERAFASNRNLTNEEIYSIFKEGRETLQMNTPGEMNFYLKLYHNRWSRVIGYTSPTVNLININWKYFRNYAPYDVAANLAHEWVHKIGFDHRSASERNSVPYAIGYIVGELGQKVLKKRKLH